MTSLKTAQGGLLVMALTLAALPVAVHAESELRVWALFENGQLRQYSTDAPATPLAEVTLQGLPEGSALNGIDFRVAYGQLYGISDRGQLWIIDTASGAVDPVGTGEIAALSGQSTGFDFNPAADRIRVITTEGDNWRLHPETGELVATDPKLGYVANDPAAGQSPVASAAAYTYNTDDDSLTTNFAIDQALGTLLTQGTREGAADAISPNTGQLFTVGPLGLGALSQVSFDISDIDNRALAAIRSERDEPTHLYEIDLVSGAARDLGRLGNGEAVIGLAIEP